MTPQQINKTLLDIQKKLRCSREVLYSEGPLSGVVTCGYKLGVNYLTGDIYYKDEFGDWQLAPSSGGGGGGGGTASRGKIMATVDSSIVLTNTTSGLGDLIGIEDASTSITFPDFTGSTLQIFLGGTELPGLDPETGEMYYTLAGDTVTFTNGALAATNKLSIYIL